MSEGCRRCGCNIVVLPHEFSTYKLVFQNVRLKTTGCYSWINYLVFSFAFPIIGLVLYSHNVSSRGCGSEFVLSLHPQTTANAICIFSIRINLNERINVSIYLLSHQDVFPYI